MKRIITSIAAAAAVLVGAACEQRIEHAQADGITYFEATCDYLTVHVEGYPANTTFFVTADGAPPLHLKPEIGFDTYTFPYYVHSYGLYIRLADGTVIENSNYHNQSVC